MGYHENLSSSVTAADHARALRHGASHSYQFVASPLSHGSNPNSNMAGRRREDDENLVSFDAEQSYNDPDELAYLTRKLRRSIASPATGVRRLTPRECERLQALPDDWTAHGPDSRRYAALGDAVTASVGEWIGRRLIAA